MIRILYFLILGSTLSSLLVPLFAQSEKPAVRACRSVNVQTKNLIYLQANEVIIGIKLPDRWLLDSKHRYPFYFLLESDSYEPAHTYMYITVEALEVSFEKSIDADVAIYKQYCDALNIVTLPSTPLLEQGCEHKTQILTCNKQQESYVDLITRIDFNGSLVQVALSADTSDMIEHYRNDYDFLLKNLTMIESIK